MELHLHEWGNPAAPPVVCIHGVNAHGRRFRRLAEEHLATRFRVLAPDLRGHGFSDWEPPWTIATHAHDVLETLDAAGVRNALFVGHSFGGRLILELARLDPDRLQRVALLDPAIQILPHVAFDQAEALCAFQAFGSVEEAIAARAESAKLAPREYLEEEVDDHLVEGRDGRFRYRFARAAAATIYGELATEPPEPPRVPTLIVHAVEFGIFRDDQLDAYREALGDLLEVVAVPGGHIVFWDAFAETADAIDAFLEDPRA
jgi:lipase